MNVSKFIAHYLIILGIIFLALSAFSWEGNLEMTDSYFRNGLFGIIALGLGFILLELTKMNKD